MRVKLKMQYKIIEIIVTDLTVLNILNVTIENTAFDGRQFECH
jgi:hypothetical protein